MKKKREERLAVPFCARERFEQFGGLVI